METARVCLAASKEKFVLHHTERYAMLLSGSAYHYRKGAVPLLFVAFLAVGYTHSGTQAQLLEASLIPRSGHLFAASVIPNHQTIRSPTTKNPRPLRTRNVMVSAIVDSKASIYTLASTNVLKNSQIGYSLLFPDGWQVSGYVQWTEFAEDSQCESVEVVDFRPPPGSGAGFLLHSFVQICAKPLMDSLTLDDFIRQIYGDSTKFQVTELSGMKAYLAKNSYQNTIWFLQTNRYRIQIATAVVSTPDKQDMRLSQVQRILASLSFQ